MPALADAYEIFRERAQHWDAALERGEEPSPDIIRSVYLAANSVLRIYCGPHNWRHGQPIEAIPLQLIHMIANQIQYIAAGQIPDPIKQLTHRGRVEAGPHESRDIGIAVAYLRSVEAGAIKDSRPVITVAEAYSVTRRTVMRWKSELSWVKPEHFYPSAAGAGERAELIAAGMVKAGKQYGQLGRSARAIASRNSKRHPRR